MAILIQVAVKVVDKTSFKSSDQRQHAQNEKAICERFASRLRHKNIVNVYQVASDESNVFVAMEYVDGGELFEKIKQRHRLDESTARRWFREIIEAVDYIHKNGIVHRDLKPENGNSLYIWKRRVNYHKLTTYDYIVLIDRKHSIRLCDFGFGKFCERQQVLNTYCGSPFYAAPEMVTATPYRGPPVDMWSCGVILYAMLAGTLPFQGQDMPQLFRRINNVSYTMPRHITPEAANLIERLLCKNPTQRITAHDCLRHPWLNHKKLPCLPTNRPTPLFHPTARQPSTITTATTKVSSSSILVEKKHCQNTTTSSPSSSSPPSTRSCRSVSRLPRPTHQLQRKQIKYSKFWTKLLFIRHKTQVVPSADKDHHHQNTNSQSPRSSKSKIKSVESKVAHQVKGLLKSAFQRRLT